MSLDGKIALVTGGNNGIGLAIVEKFLSFGASVAVVDLDGDNIAEASENCKFYKADVSDFTRAENLVGNILKDFSRIDILVNNAGINLDGVIWKMSEAQWDSVTDVNLKGCFNYCRMVSPHFKRQSSGKIVNISSINGMRGKFGQANYSASKAGIIGLTKTLAKELGRYGINVNAVSPGLIESEMTDKLPKDALSVALAETALNKFGKAEDVANLVAFLCSDLASHITGEIIKVDGGQYI
jgi:3-oxoacyl-[acyl-carrier protein] reductase